jgi:twitching motility protein PilT
MKLLTSGVIDAEQAYNKAATKSKFREFLTTPPQDFTEV